MGAGGQQAQPQPGHQRQAVGAKAGMQILGQIVAADDHALQSRMGGDLGGVQHALGGLEHSPKRRGRDQRRRPVQHGAAADLGDQHRIGAAGENPRIGLAPFGVEAVDPDDPRAAAVIRQQRPRQQLAGRHFLGRGHRILEVKDDRIGRQVAGLFHGPGIGCRDIENRAIGDHRDLALKFIFRRKIGDLLENSQVAKAATARPRSA